MRYCITLFASLVILVLSAQQVFDPSSLEDPKKYGSSVAAQLGRIEIKQFDRNIEGQFVLLENDLRSSRYVDADNWLSIADTVTAIKVSIIFSKYPVRKSGYKMNHPLLFNRIKNLLEIDPSLNSKDVEWNLTLQTNCVSDEQVDELFHGVMIEYQFDESIERSTITTVSNTYDQMKVEPSLNNAIQDPVTLLSILSENISPKEKVEDLTSFLEEQISESSGIPPTKKQRRELIKEAKNFLNTYGYANDSIVFKVLDRRKEWTNALVVADWTGSMYGYGGQAYLWHLLNLEKSGLQNFTIFNDGDMKRFGSKKIGETDGIYHAPGADLDVIMETYLLTMSKGSGGESEENDLEAILRGTERFPDQDAVILIADNNACVRDMALIDSIKVPVRVILCGTTAKSKINPQYAKIADKTGGSLHTIEQDILNFSIEYSSDGSPERFIKHKLEIGKDYCKVGMGSASSIYYSKKEYRSIDEAKEEKKDAAVLNLSNSALDKMPRAFRKLHMIRVLDLSHNLISDLKGQLRSNWNLLELDLSHNKIEELEPDFCPGLRLHTLNVSNNELKQLRLSSNRFRELRRLNLSNNEIEFLPKNIYFQKLEVLDISNNPLENLPRAISRCKKLQELHVSSASLEKIPTSLPKLRKLEILDLSNNNINAIPYGMERLQSLRTLILTNNPLADEDIQTLRKKLPLADIVFD